MRRLFSALLLALLLAVPAAAEVRAVFVGIDRYQFAGKGPPALRFANLRGAVSDTARIKAALAKAMGLAVDQPGSDCRSANAISITLTNECATRDAILEAWRDMIEASQPGDTLILYFAGHGSVFRDTGSFSQAGGENSTLMAHDARNPELPGTGEIADLETRQIIDAATARGLRVVTWFDSCHSGTANRSGADDSAPRWAPALTLSGPWPGELPEIRRPVAAGTVPGWRVHLAASADDQTALERTVTDAGGIRTRAGLFTRALAGAIEAMPDATFFDIAERVRAEVETATSGAQQPQAEGALRATIAGQEVRVPVFAVMAGPQEMALQGGSLVGVTPGSRFALFGDVGTALSAGPARALVTARVASAGPASAALQAEAPAAAPLPAALYARELAHEWGRFQLRLAVTDAAALAVVQKLGFVRAERGAPFSLTVSGDATLLARSGGAPIARLPLPDDAQFPLRLAWALEKVARVEAWLAGLQGMPRAPGLLLCLWPDSATARSPMECPPQRAPVAMPLGRESSFSVRNQAGQNRHVYVLVVSPDYSVLVVMPPNQGRDQALKADDELRSNDIARLTPNTPGRYRFVALSSARPIDPGVLAQEAAGVLEREACGDASAASRFCPTHNRDRGPAGEGWSVTIIDAEVSP